MHKEVNDLYSSPNIFRVTKLRIFSGQGHVARTEKQRDGRRVFMRKTEGKRVLGRLRSTWGTI